MTKNKPVRRKLLSNTPINIRISKEQQDAIKKPPRISFSRFQTSIADATDWYNIAFRLRVGLSISRQEYTQETTVEINAVFKLWETIMVKAKQITGPMWHVDRNVLDEIEAGLDAVDTMQDETTRRVQLHAHLEAQKVLNKYVNEFDEYLKTIVK